MDEERGGSDLGPWTLRRCGVLGVVCVLLCVLYKVVQHRNFLTNAFDLAIYDNVAWNVAAGRGFWSDLLRMNHMGEHFCPFTAVAAPFYLVWPSPLVLMVLQGVGVGLAVPLLLAAFDHVLRGESRRVRLLLPPAMVVLLLASRGFANAVQLDFHPSTAGVALLAGAILALRTGRDRTLWVMVLLLLTTKEMALASVAGLGIYARTVLGRRRLALWLVVVAVLGAFVEMGLVIPHFRGAEWGHFTRLGPLDLLDQKGRYLLGMTASQAFLPLLAPPALLAAVPNLLVNLVSAGSGQTSMARAYDDHTSIFLSLAAVHGAVFLLQRSAATWRFSTPRPRVLLAAGAAVVVVAGLALPWGSVPIAARTLLPHPVAARARARLAPYAALPPDVGMVAFDRLAPHVAHRHRITALSEAPNPAAHMQAGDLVLLPGPAMAVLWEGRGIQVDAELLADDARFEIVDRDDLLVVYRLRSEEARGR